MIREQLHQNPIIRELRGGHADKVIGQALGRMEGWESVGSGSVRRLGRKARWYSRFHTSDPRSDLEFVSVSEIKKHDDDVDDLLS